MYEHPFYHSQDYHHCCCHAEPHSNLLALFGGAIGLATALLRGSASVVCHVAEGTMWHSCGHDAGHHHHGCRHHSQHYHIIEHYPSTCHCCGPSHCHGS